MFSWRQGRSKPQVQHIKLFTCSLARVQLDTYLRVRWKLSTKQNVVCLGGMNSWESLFMWNSWISIRCALLCINEHIHTAAQGQACCNTPFLTTLRHIWRSWRGDKLKEWLNYLAWISKTQMKKIPSLPAVIICLLAKQPPTEKKFVIYKKVSN